MVQRMPKFQHKVTKEVMKVDEKSALFPHISTSPSWVRLEESEKPAKPAKGDKEA